MKMGIYKIINVVNNKFYVGSAVNFSRRKSRHFSELRNGRHNNSKLQNAWDKYGESSFLFAIVEEVKDREVLLEAENRWLKEHVGKDYCYNIGVDATAPMLGMSGELSPTWGRKRTPNELAAQYWGGRTHSKESKAKISTSLQGHEVSIATRAKISATLSGKGNFWYGKKRPDHSVKVSKPIRITYLTGDSTTYPSISMLRQDTGMNPPTVNRALKSGKPIARGKFVGCVINYEC